MAKLPKTIENRASVTWGSPSFTLTSNEVSIEVGPSGFLQISKSDGLDTVYTNQAISYTISLTNTGSIPVILNRITDTFISNVSYVSINKNGLTMNEVTSSGNTRIWSFPSKSLNPGEKITFLIGGKTASIIDSYFTINQAYASGTDYNGRELFRNNGASLAQDSDTISGYLFTVFLPQVILLQ